MLFAWNLVTPDVHLRVLPHLRHLVGADFVHLKVFAHVGIEPKTVYVKNGLFLAPVLVSNL